ncbi:tetratricopeptide repeat protein [Chitinibacter sp. S2-10]|uniref:tetratricopeptide repeat protein n=1 Tax=Chitinibacter sp. S2-10 TaxID=3373597 RepID=UPI0039777473
MKFIAWICLLFCSVAMAAGGGGSSGGNQTDTSSVQRLKQVEGMIKTEQWLSAEEQLAKLRQHDAENADVWNWSGYVARKSGRLDEAFPHYERALQINPKHLGAHEYLGEAYLQANQLEKAREQLEILQGLCGECEEARELAEAIGPQPAIE